MQEIASAIAVKKCVVFAGAGLSMNAGLPGWSDLIGHLISELSSKGKLKAEFKPALDSLLKQNQLSVCMDTLLLAASRRDILAMIREAFKTTKRSEVHNVLKKLNLRGFITTNYDRLLEEICDGTHYRLTNSVEKLSLVPLALGKPTVQFVLKLHGDLDDEWAPDHNEVAKGGPFIVLSSSDYTVMLQGQRGESLKLALHSVLQGAAILFLGYSYGDPDIKMVLDFLTKNLQFAHQSWYVALKDQQVPTLPSNITPIQPLNHWGELGPWLEQLLTLANSESASHEQTSGGTYTVPERDRKALLALGEYIYGLETEDLFSKTILSILVPELRKTSSMTEQWLSQFIAQLLDVGPNWADAFAKAVVKELLETKLVVQGGEPNTYQANTAQINRVYKKANTEWQAERDEFYRSLSQRLTKSGLELNAELFEKLEQVFQFLSMEYGHSMAEWIHRGIGSEGLPNTQGVVAQYFSAAEDRRRISELLNLIFTNPTEGETNYIYRLLSSAFLLNSVKLDPTASKFVQEGLRQYHLYLDANVLLPLIVREHTNHGWISSLVHMTRQAGVNLYVIEDILEEVQGHRRIAQELFTTYRNDIESLALYRALNGNRSNCFIDGYLNSPHRRTRRWGDYIKGYNDRWIHDFLTSLEITVVKVSTDKLNAAQYGQVLSEIEKEWAARLHGNRRNHALNRHEAKQFMHIYAERKKQFEKGASDDVWFLSSETVFEKVFLIAPQQWGKPPTFPLSAWASFIDSRMVFNHPHRKDVLLAILQGNSTAYSLPGPMTLVRKRLFGQDRVLSKEEYESLKITFSGGQLFTRLEKAREEVVRRSHRNVQVVKEYSVLQQAAEEEVKLDMNERLEAASQREKSYKDKVERLTKRVAELEKRNSQKSRS